MTGPIETIEQATAALERVAELSAKRDMIGRRRDVTLARANAAADRLAAPIVAELTALTDRLKPWWAANAAALTQGKRKSIELGGCMIGIKAGRASLELDGATFSDEAEKLRKLAWGAGYVTVTYAVDKAAVRKALSGPDGAKLKRRGFREKAGEETFFVEPVAQGGAVSTN